MIKEKELRIGNIYSSKRNKDIVVRGIDTINKVVVIEEPDLEVAEQPYIFEDLSPINITKESVIKFGFIKDEDAEIYKKDVDCELSCAVLEFRAEGCFFKDREGNKIGSQIEYLHQLQNIYFFLMGEEI